MSFLTKGSSYFFFVDVMQDVLYNVFKRIQKMEGTVVWKKEEGFLT